MNNDTQTAHDTHVPNPAPAMMGKDSTVLLHLAAEAELFHTPDGLLFARVTEADRTVIDEIDSSLFTTWLSRRFYQVQRKAPSANSLKDALETLKGQALFDGPEEPVAVRVARHHGNVYLDLANAAGEVVEMTPQGWSVITPSPVNFWRPNGMLSLPTPSIVGSVEELGAFLNLPQEDGLELVVAWVLGALAPEGPYPLLVVTGEQGSAKSTLSRLVRGLIDPNSVLLRHLPRTTQDLMIAATRGWILAFDNLSKISDDTSDALCGLATGGGYATRKLYTTADEHLFTATRPVILNGIDNVAARPDLLDRAIVLHLPRIDNTQRKTESALLPAFAEAHPRMLGAFCTAVCTALANRATVALEAMPRMADFAKWIVAAEPAMPWASGRLMAAYDRNLGMANELALEDSLIVDLLEQVVGEGQTWTGTATGMFGEMKRHYGREFAGAMPRSERALSQELNRLKPNLRQIGFDISRSRQANKRLLCIYRRKEVNV